MHDFAPAIVEALRLIVAVDGKFAEIVAQSLRWSFAASFCAA
jgi:hypothetical protein